MKTYLHQGAAELPTADFRAGQGASRMSGGSGGKLRLPAQGLQPFQVASNFVFPAEAVIIRKVGVAQSSLKIVPDRNMQQRIAVRLHLHMMGFKGRRAVPPT